MSFTKNHTLQRILSIIILLLIPLFIIHEFKILKPKKNLIFSNLSEPSINEFSKNLNKSFVIVVFCNEITDFCDLNLNSIFNQTYPHYRVIILENSKTQNNHKMIKNFIRTHGHENIVTFVKDEPTVSYSHLLYKAIQSCRDDEVIVHLESTDWFVNNHVLEKLNQTYLDPDVWLTYGECLSYPSLEHLKLKPPVNKTFKQHGALNAPWMLSHLKTYYAGLFKKLAPPETEDSNDNNNFLSGLLNMAKWHIRLIPEALYVHTSQEP